MKRVILQTIGSIVAFGVAAKLLSIPSDIAMYAGLLVIISTILTIIKTIK